MRDHIKRIISEVAEGSAGWANRHKKVIGGVGAAGAAGTLSSDQVADFYRRGIGLGRRAIGVGDAVEKAEAPEESAFMDTSIPSIMYGYRFPEPGCLAGDAEMHWESLRKKNP